MAVGASSATIGASRCTARTASSKRRRKKRMASTPDAFDTSTYPGTQGYLERGHMLGHRSAISRRWFAGYELGGILNTGTSRFPVYVRCLPSLPAGVDRNDCVCHYCGDKPSSRFRLRNPGATELTVMPRSPSSRAQAASKPVQAGFGQQVTESPRKPLYRQWK